MGDASPLPSLEAWMSQLPAWTKERSICELALPGAHNAAATSVECIPTNILAPYLGETLSHVSLIQMLAKPVAKVPALCQSDSIFCLLQRGIRLLDLRLGMHHQEIHICHTVVCSTTLRGVLVELRRFLHEHPEEVVVLLIKRDWEHRYFDTNENWLKTQEMLKEELGEMLMLEEDMKQPIRSLVKQGRLVLAMLEMPQFVTHIGFGVLITNGNLLSSWRASDQTARDQLERIETWCHNGLLKPQAGDEKRSKSCPPVPGVMAETCDFWAKEAGCHLHVTDLANRAEELMLERKPTSSPEIEEALSLPSLGSYGHPELCARPCVFWILNKDCVKGAGCPFCHEHHGSKMSSFDKAQRNIMTRLRDSEKIFLLLPLVQRKAQQGWHEAEEILELLQGSFPATEVHGIDGFSPKTINSLVKVMERMSLMALLGVLSKYISEEPLAQHLDRAIKKLPTSEGRGEIPH
eukprot:symbB.v1.2.036084.t1/scaffold5015.1/size31789/4